MRAKHVWKPRFAHGVNEVIILRPPLALAHALTLVNGQGRPRESTPPSLCRPRGHLNDCAEFLAVALRRLLGTMG